MEPKKYTVHTQVMFLLDLPIEVEADTQLTAEKAVEKEISDMKLSKAAELFPKMRPVDWAVQYTTSKEETNEQA